MAPDSTPKTGMSLYGHLLDPSSDVPGTISRAPVVFKQNSETEAQAEGAAGKKQLNAGSYN